MAKKISLQSFYVGNYKNIEELSADVEGRHFILFGKNGEGKTSAVQAIMRNAQMIEPGDLASMPIKIGAKRSELNTTFKIEEDGEISHILVKTIVRPSGQELQVIDLRNNGELKPPVARLQKLLGVAADVTPLFEMEGSKQFEYMLKVLGGQEKFETFKAELKQLYDARRDANRDSKMAEKEVVDLDMPLDVVQAAKTKGEYIKKIEFTEEKPSRIAVDLEMQRVKSENELYDRVVERREERANKIAAHNERMEQLRREIEALEEACEELEAQQKESQEWLDKNQKLDIEVLFAEKTKEIDEKIRKWEIKKNEVDAYNRTVERLAQYNAAKEKAKQKSDAAVEAQKKYEQKAKDLQAAIAALNVSALVPELMLFNEGDDPEIKDPRVGLYYRIGEDQYIPFHIKQVSYAKGIIAMAKLASYINHEKFNMIHIPMWGELDDDSRAEILAFARDNEDLNIQFAIEEVRNEVLGFEIIEDLPE